MRVKFNLRAALCRRTLKDQSRCSRHKLLPYTKYPINDSCYHCFRITLCTSWNLATSCAAPPVVASTIKYLPIAVSTCVAGNVVATE